jgi:hypothetical protein
MVDILRRLSTGQMDRLVLALRDLLAAVEEAQRHKVEV